jgi:opacity protein-like surface antigen
VGGTGGAGAEYALTKHWSAGAEYRYSGYQNATFHLGTVDAFGPPFELAAVSGSVGLRTHEVAVKLNYKF